MANCAQVRIWSRWPNQAPMRDLCDIWDTRGANLRQGATIHHRQNTGILEIMGSPPPLHICGKSAWQL